MEIIVPIKHVVDVELDIRVKEGQIIKDGLLYVINNWDEVAIEAALKLTETVGGSVTLVTIGGKEASVALRKALAMGAHQAIHILDSAFEGSDSSVYATALAQLLKKRSWDLIITGKQAQDTDAALTPGMLAEFLDIAHVSNVCEIESVDSNSLHLQRKADVGKDVMELSLPALISVNDSLHEPRLASMRGIMKAKRIKIETLGAEALGMTPEMCGNTGSQTEVTAYHRPSVRTAGERFEGDETETTTKLMNALFHEAKVFA